MTSNDDHFDTYFENYLTGILLQEPNQHDFKNKFKCLYKTIDLSEFSRKLNLTFIQGSEAEGEVCFANSTNLRDDFRVSFTIKDLLDFLYAMLQSKGYRDKTMKLVKKDIPRVFYPEDADVFWKLVSKGRELHQNLSSPRQDLLSEDHCDSDRD